MFNINNYLKVLKNICKKRVQYYFFTFFLCFICFLLVEKTVFAGGVSGKPLSPEEQEELDRLQQRYNIIQQEYEGRRKPLEEEHRDRERRREESERRLRELEDRVREAREERSEEEKKDWKRSEEEKKQQEEERRRLEKRICELECRIHRLTERVFQEREGSGRSLERLHRIEEAFSREVQALEEEKRAILRQSESSDGEALRREEEVCKGIRVKRDTRREERKQGEIKERYKTRGTTPEEDRKREDEERELRYEEECLREENHRRKEEEDRRKEEERKREEEHRRKEEERKREEERRRREELERNKERDREEKEKRAQENLARYNQQELARHQASMQEEAERRHKKAEKRRKKEEEERKKREEKRKQQEDDERLVDNLLETLVREGRQNVSVFPGGEDPEVQRRGEKKLEEEERRRKELEEEMKIEKEIEEEKEKEESMRERRRDWREKVRLRQETLALLDRVDPGGSKKRAEEEAKLKEEERKLQEKEEEEYEKKKRERERERAKRERSLQRAHEPLDHASQQGSLHATQQATDSSVSHIGENRDTVKAQSSSHMGCGAETSSSKLKNNRIFIHRKTTRVLHPLLQRGAQLQVPEIFYSSEAPRRVFISAFGESKRRPKEKGYGGQVGLIVNPVSKLRFGVSYGYISNDMREYGITKVSSFGAMKTKTTTNVLSGVVAWNVNKPGVTGLIIGSHGWGNVKTTRMFIHQNIHLYAKGKPEAKVNGITGQVGYNISLFDICNFFEIEASSVEGMLITPYLELSKIKSSWESFKEMECVTPAYIDSLKSSIYEETIGLRYQWPINKTLDFQAWCSCITRQKSISPLSSIVETKRAIYFFEVSEKKWSTTEAELGTSISIYLSSNLGTTITGSICTKDFGCLSSEKINITLWYDF